MRGGVGRGAEEKIGEDKEEKKVRSWGNCRTTSMQGCVNV